MKLSISRLTYILYIKGNRYIGNFETAEIALKYAAENYKGIEAHVEHCVILTEATEESKACP